jgi:hypothetical protein
MSDITNIPKSAKTNLHPESDLSQVLAHGPALSLAYGKTLGGVLMLVAILKVSRGSIGIAAAMSAVGMIACKFWK